MTEPRLLQLGDNSIDSNLLNDIQKLVDGTKNRKPTAANTIQPTSSTTTTNAAYPPSPTTSTPNKNNPMDPISIGRSKMKEAMDNVNSRPIELPVEFIISCTNTFAEDRKLGHGSFGAVYKGMDDNQYFAVKCLRFNLAFLEDQKKGISKSFINELQVSSSVVSSIACCLSLLCFSFFYHTVSGLKEVPTPSYCNFVRLSFVPCFI